MLEILGLGRQISSFGFLFDTIPTGPSVFVYSILFRCGSNLVSICVKGSMVGYVNLVSYVHNFSIMSFIFTESGPKYIILLSIME